jgi:3D (Asp-Asp-Asp) domain-containing protein
MQRRLKKFREGKRKKRMEKLYEQIYKYIRNCFIGIGIFGVIIILILGLELNKLSKENEQLKSKQPETIIVERDISPIPYKELGEYTISFYCDCSICTKTAKGSKTATGTKPKEGTTIACDGKILKMGDIVYIESVGVRICQDKGSAIKQSRIDVYMDDHDIANKMGIRKVNVYKIGG